MIGYMPETSPVVPCDPNHVSFTQPSRCFAQSVQNGLQVEFRAANNLEDIRRCCLLLERFT